MMVKFKDLSMRAWYRYCINKSIKDIPLDDFLTGKIKEVYMVFGGGPEHEEIKIKKIDIDFENIIVKKDMATIPLVRCSSGIYLHKYWKSEEIVFQANSNYTIHTMPSGREIVRQKYFFSLEAAEEEVKIRKHEIKIMIEKLEQASFNLQKQIAELQQL